MVRLVHRDSAIQIIFNDIILKCSTKTKQEQEKKT